MCILVKLSLNNIEIASNLVDEFDCSYISSNREEHTIYRIKLLIFTVSKFMEYSSIPISVLTGPSNLNTCLITSSSKWVIDSGATIHIIGNPNLFSPYKLHSCKTPVTLGDSSSSQVVGLWTPNLTSTIHLTSVLNLPNFSFNIISIS